MPRVPAKKRGQKRAAKRSARKAARTSSNGDQSRERALKTTIQHFNEYQDADFDWIGVVEASKKDKNLQLLERRNN